jgi:hypothetical protein
MWGNAGLDGVDEPGVTGLEHRFKVQPTGGSRDDDALAPVARVWRRAHETRRFERSEYLRDCLLADPLRTCQVRGGNSRLADDPLQDGQLRYGQAVGVRSRRLTQPGTQARDCQGKPHRQLGGVIMSGQFVHDQHRNYTS